MNTQEPGLWSRCLIPSLVGFSVETNEQTNKQTEIKRKKLQEAKGNAIILLLKKEKYKNFKRP